MKAKRILEELLEREEPIPEALLWYFWEKHDLNPLSALIGADRRRRLVRRICFVPFLVIFTGVTLRAFDGGVSTTAAWIEVAILASLVGGILFALLPLAFSISYGDKGENRFFYDLANLRQYCSWGRLSPAWQDRSKLRVLAEDQFFNYACTVVKFRAHHGEFSDQAKTAECQMKECYRLFEFYNLLPQFESSHDAYKAAFDWANQQEIPPAPVPFSSL